MNAKRVCIIGAGPSGLAMGRRLLQQGISSFVILEQQDQVGGNWVWNGTGNHSSVHENTRSISSAALTAFQNFPFSTGTSAYPSREEMLNYLRRFAAESSLLPFIQFRTRVCSAEPDGSGKWLVTADAGAVGEYDFVCVCNGHHWLPLMPELPGLFDGEIVHSHQVRDSRRFAGRRVLIVGGGNTAADLAVDIDRRGGTVCMSWRRSYHVVPRFIFGIPSDRMYAGLRRVLPAAIANPFAALVVRTVQRAQTGSLLPRPDHPLFSTHPLVHGEILHFLNSGRVSLRGPLVAVDSRTITFSDGTKDTFDTILACTGYQVSFPFLRPEVLGISGSVPDLLLRVFHRQSNGLIFVGLIQPSGSIWPIADRQAHLAALSIAGRVSSAKIDAADRRWNAAPRPYIASPRHSLEVDFHSYKHMLDRLIDRCVRTAAPVSSAGQ